MAPKVRTQVLLERRQYDSLKRLAYERRSSLSAIVRELLDHALGRDTETGEAVREVRLAFVGSGLDIGGKCDVARRHDDYLYGETRGE